MNKWIAQALEMQQKTKEKVKKKFNLSGNDLSRMTWC